MSTRERILDEATRQIVAKGYSAFTIAGVREALDLSSGSMFHAFPSKPALAAAVYVRGMEAYQRAATAAIRSSSDPASAVEAWVGAHLGWVASNRDLARHLFTTQPPEVIEASTDALEDANAAFYVAVEDLLAAVAAAGLSASIPLAVGFGLIMGPAQEYCRRWTRGDADDDPRDLVALHQRGALAALRSTCSV